jgi:hypothetical protein
MHRASDCEHRRGERMENKIKVFLSAGYGYGAGYSDGYGDGYSYGHGAGYGHGDGHGYGYGYGHGYGDGHGAGYGDGDGHGHGYGYGHGHGYGDGSGYGYKINNKMVYNVDDVSTIITSVKGNIAKGYIVNDDMTINKTYIVKGNGYFAHGETLAEASQSLQGKIISDMDTDEIIELFLQDVDTDKKYPASYFFDWHGKLTGSCKQGRESFVKNKGIDLNGLMDVHEFISLTVNEYGGDVIRQLKEELAAIIGRKVQSNDNT